MTFTGYGRTLGMLAKEFIQVNVIVTFCAISEDVTCDIV